jgi:putative DNA primase/helicase
MRWAIDDGGDVEHRMKETVRGIYAEAAMETDEAQRKQIADHARRSEGRKRQTDALLLARSELAIRPEEMDRNPYLLNCANGTVDLRTGVLRPHDPFDYITKLAPIHYHISMEAPTFVAFLERILPSLELRQFVQAVIGYAAIGVNTEEMLPIFHGRGANGKSTLVNVVMEALGDYAQQAAPDLLMSKHRSHPTELADLFGARFVAAVETDEGRRLNEGLVKQLTGRDKIKARRMNEDFWEFQPTHTPVLATNHKPEIRGTDHAIWRRLKLVPFDVQIPDKEQDKKLAEKLREELPGVLAWIVRGALIYQKVGLPEAERVTDATSGYRTEMDTLAGFVDECCVVRPEAWCKFADLYTAYVAWCEESNEHPEKKRRFADRLTERGFARDVGAQNTKIRRGIALRHDGGPDPSKITDTGSKTTPERAPQTPNGKTNGNPTPTGLPNGNPRNPGKTAEFGGSVTDGCPENDLLAKNCHSHEDYVETTVTIGNSVTSSDKNAGKTPPARRLSAEETEHVKRLIAEGMAPAWARAEVLGDEEGAA